MSADDTRYILEITGLPLDVFVVERIEGQETMSDCYTYKIEALSAEVELDYTDLIGKEATLSLKDNDAEIFRHGIVYHAQEEWTGNGTSRYYLQLRPKLFELSMGQSCRVFQKQSIQDITQAIFKERGFQEFKLDAVGGTQPREWTVQYNESDLHFLQRLWQESGFFFYFDHTDSYEELIIGDQNTSAKTFPDPFPFITDAGLLEHSHSIVRLSRSHSLKTGSVALKDYFYQTPRSNIYASVAGSGSGPEHYAYGKDTLDVSAAKELSQTMQESFDIGRNYVYARTRSSELHTGMVITMADSCGPFAGDYLIVKLNYNASQEATITGGGEDKSYAAELTLIEATQSYRAPFTYEKPKISGFIIAQVDGKDSPYAFLDDKGRYTAKMPFDLEDTDPGMGSLPVRLNQPYAGSDYGFHFPVHKGNDLVIGFENGDIDRPFALGVAPNPANSSPINSENRALNKIKTHSGHEVILDDTEEKENIQIITKGLHNLTMMDDAETQSINLKSTTEHNLILDDKNKKITLDSAAKLHNLTFDDETKFIHMKTESGHILKLDQENKIVQLQTANGHILSLDDDGGLMTLQDSAGKHTIQIDEGSGISITTEGDISLAAKGNIDMEAAEINMTSKGAINLSSTQDTAIEGANLNLKGKQKAQIEAGMDLGLKGGMNLKMEGGMNVESKAGVANKMTGTMTNVESSAINTIKGAMVMIN
jgi:type VI secretion system secreted protein VgrG